MNIITETRGNIENWLSRKQRKTYKRMKTDNYRGYLYQVTLPDPKITATVVLRLTDLNMLVLELYSGIRVLNPVLMAPVALYCQQRVKTRFGDVEAEPISGCITYRVETTFRERAVGEATLELYEEEAIRTICAHYQNLKALAEGKLLALEEPVKIAPPADKKEAKKMDKTEAIEAIRTYLESQNHNIKAEKLHMEGDPEGFLCEIRVRSKHFMVNYEISDCGILTLTGRCGTTQIPVKKEYQYAVAEYLNRQNASNLYGNFCMGTEDTGWFYRIDTSLLEEPASERIISNMERILIHSMMECASTVDRLAAGLLISDERSEKELLQHFATMANDFRSDVLGGFPFGEDAEDDEIMETDPDNDWEEEEAKGNDTEDDNLVDDVTMDDWLRQIGLEDPAPEAG